MPQKAMITSLYALTDTDGEWEITGTAAITVGQNGHIVLPFGALADSFHPVPGWRARIRDAVIAAAALEEYEVDEVMFPDFGVLGL